MMDVNHPKSGLPHLPHTQYQYSKNKSTFANLKFPDIAFASLKFPQASRARASSSVHNWADFSCIGMTNDDEPYDN